MYFGYLPWLKILVSFVLGILVAGCWVVNTNKYWLLLPILLLYFLFHQYYRRYNKFVLFVFSSSIVFLFAFFYTQFYHQPNQQLHYAKFSSKYALAYVYKPFEEKEKSYKTVLKLYAVMDTLHKMRYVNGKLLVYTTKSDVTKQYKIGDKLLIKLDYKPIDEPKNPYQFNYRKYLSYEGVYYQSYLKDYEIKFISTSNKYLIKKWSHRLSLAMQNLLKKYIPKNENFVLADGILLGHKSEIDPELYAMFSHTGIVHILSVSGLHVGIVYLLISFLLRFIPNRNLAIKIYKFLITAVLIWLFAFVVGLSPAVVRAALLFSLIHFGKLIKEDASSLNILFGAAFIQLIINPLLIYNIGFQLSYLAMLGLFIFYKPIYALYYSPQKWIDYVWQLWSASIAAQIFTTPLVIYYFGNFPTYFLLANIFAIPLSILILWSSIAILPFSISPPLAKIVGCFTSLCIDVFIKCTKFIAQLPFAKIDYLHIDFVQVVLLYIVIFLLILLVIYVRFQYILHALGLAIVTMLLSYYFQYHQYQREEVVLYNSKNNLIISHQTKDKFFIYSKDTLSFKDYSFNVHNTYRASYARKQEKIIINSNLLQINNNLFYILNNNFYQTFTNKINVDYLIIANNIYMDIDKINEVFAYKRIILSCTNDYKRRSIYKKILQQNNLRYIDLNDKYVIISL